jgi:predicted acyltransferase
VEDRGAGPSGTPRAASRARTGAFPAALFGMQLGLPEGLTEPGLASRLSWVTALRLAVITLLLGLTQAFFFYSGFAVEEFSLKLVLLTLAIAFALAGVYAAWRRRGRQLVAMLSRHLWMAMMTDPYSSSEHDDGYKMSAVCWACVHILTST